MREGFGVTTLVAALALALAPAAPAQLLPNADLNGYCVPENTQFDPQDLERPDAPPIVVPPGFVRHEIKVGGFRTMAIEAGNREAKEAVVFMHGNPGSSLDFLGLLETVPKGTRVIAFDILGFGEADKPYDFPYDLPASRDLADRVFEELGVERMHLVGHDVGSVVGVDWAARHPEKLASATLIAGGLLIGFVDHHFGVVWKTPFVGEESMRMTDRESFVNVLQLQNPRPLPREFIDRNYDYFDRASRCAVLKIYRSMPNMTLLGLENAEKLRPHDIPALVIWGDRDPFLPAHMAYTNRLGFPSADVHVFPNSGHWPYVDTEQRTIGLMSEFLGRHARPPSP